MHLRLPCCRFQAIKQHQQPLKIALFLLLWLLSTFQGSILATNKQQITVQNEKANSSDFEIKANKRNGYTNKGKQLLILWWNVENLFDAEDDPRTRDDDFTPNGKLQWTAQKVALKEQRIRYLLKAINAHPDYHQYPDVIGFAEVENQNIFNETLSGLHNINYKTIHYESSDPRGIDVALAYNPQKIQLINSKAYQVKLSHPTRDVIVATFLASRRPFHVVANHWPSRSFDDAWSEPNRLAAAKVARHIVDSLRTKNPLADIVVMGDCNDEPENRSLQEVLGSSFDASRVKAENTQLLYNCWANYHGIGSYFYHNHWQRIDHILLSAGMLDSKGLSANDADFRCFDFAPLLKNNGKGTYSTYEKRQYVGGFSDHLPLLLKAHVK